jgi:hypothetical protein
VPNSGQRPIWALETKEIGAAAEKITMSAQLV